MFYSTDVLTKKGALSKAWLAAHWDKKLNRQQVMTTDLNKITHDILNPNVPLALRMSGHLLVGVVKIYGRKVEYLFKDTHDSHVKIRMVRGNALAPAFFGRGDLPSWIDLSMALVSCVSFSSHSGFQSRHKDRRGGERPRKKYADAGRQRCARHRFLRS
jgi:hypothetical protein